MDGIDAGSVESVSHSSCHELTLNPVDTVSSFETIKAMSTMRDDDMQAVSKISRYTCTIRRRCHRIPLTRENQHRHI